MRGIMRAYRDSLWRGRIRGAYIEGNTILYYEGVVDQVHIRSIYIEQERYIRHITYLLYRGNIYTRNTYINPIKELI